MIEQWLQQLESGEISSDGEDEDNDDLNYYATREEIRADLESQQNENEEPGKGNGENNDEDAPLIQDDPPDTQHVPQISSSQVRFTWRKQSMTLDDNNMSFRGNTEYPQELLDLYTVPYQYFSYFLTKILWNT